MKGMYTHYNLSFKFSINQYGYLSEHGNNLMTIFKKTLYSNAIYMERTYTLSKLTFPMLAVSHEEVDALVKNLTKDARRGDSSVRFEVYDNGLVISTKHELWKVFTGTKNELQNSHITVKRNAEGL